MEKERKREREREMTGYFHVPLREGGTGSSRRSLTGGERGRGCHCVTNDGEFLTLVARDGSPPWDHARHAYALSDEG